MTKQPAFCQSYEEARELFTKGELQAWDGTRWEDVPKDANCFFSRRVEEYRQRPKEPAPEFLVLRQTNLCREIRLFPDARGVTNYLWGKDMTDITVFKRVQLSSYDVVKLEKELNEA